MLEAEYKRNIHHNYLVLQGKTCEWEYSYQLKMLFENEIKGILPIEMRYLDGGIQYYYEISSKQPMSRLFQKSEISFEQGRKLLFQVAILLQQSNNFLLEEKHFILEPDFIYCDSETLDIGLLFFPEYEREWKESLEVLAEFFLQHMNHQEEQGIYLGYQFYKLTKKENFMLDDVIKLTQEKEIAEMSSPSMKQVSLNTIPYETIPCETVRDVSEVLTEKNVFLEETEEEPENTTKRVKNKTVLICMVGIVSSLILFASGLVIQNVFFYNYTESIVLMGLAVMLAVFMLLRLFFYQKSQKEQQEHKEHKERNEETLEVLEWQEDSHDEKLKDKDTKTNGEKNTERESWNLTSQSCKGDKEKRVEEYNGNTVFLGSMSLGDNRVLRGYLKGKEVEYSLKKLPAIIGKIAWYVDIVIEEESISRMHAKFFEKDGAVYLEDLNSTNGTKKNGILLEANEIVCVEAGDEIQLAEYKFLYS